MSINIPNSIMNLAVSNQVVVKIDLNKLGPIQKSNLCKMIVTGVIEGRGIPAQIARAVRADNKLPMLGFISKDYAKWDNCGEEQTAKFLPILKGAALATLMTFQSDGSNSRYYWRASREAELREQAAGFTSHASEGRAYGINKAYAKALQKLKLGSNTTVDVLSEGIKNGSVTTYDLIY